MHVMVELELKKLNAPDFTAAIREGTPSLIVLNEDAVPSIYWQPSEPRLKRQELAYELKQGAEIEGVAPISVSSRSGPVPGPTGLLSKTGASTAASTQWSPYPHPPGTHQ
jgi:hypothetical protein